MTRKDYILIAKVFENFPRLDYGAESVIEELAEEIAISLQAENPRFDRLRFLVACGVYED